MPLPLVAGALSFAARRGVVKAALAAGAKLGQLGKRAVGGAAPAGAIAAAGRAARGYFGGGVRRRRKGLKTRDLVDLLTLKSILGARHPAVTIMSLRRIR